MSGVLHPEGPEPAQTYWLRRVLVLLALLIVILVSIGVAGASMGATRQQQTPAAAPTETSPVDASSASASPSTSPSAGSSSTPSARPTPSSSSAPDKSGSSAAAPSCVRKNLKTTLGGKQMLKAGQPAAFTVRLANDGDVACRLILGRTDFELKITTGKKLMWSSRSCATATFLVAGKLELDQSLSWPMLWDGRATAAGCTTPGTALKRGTYLATATIAGGKAAELPITLR